MSTSILYHTQHIIGYIYERTYYEEGTVSSKFILRNALYAPPGNFPDIDNSRIWIYYPHIDETYAYSPRV
jgi:hypothetical protein